MINIGNISICQVGKNSPVLIAFTHAETSFLSFHIEHLNLQELASLSGKQSS